jgi:hypothetical protein
VPEPNKKLVAMVPPPRPWSEMTEAEKRAFAREVARRAESRMDRPSDPPKAR